MAADYSRIHRLLKILTLIQGQKGWTAERLADECGVKVRTIYRDLQMLEGAGIPYFFDHELKCYQIRRDFFLKPMELTLDEALAVIALGQHVGGSEQVPFMAAADRAVAKIRSQLPESIRREIDAMDTRMAIKLAASMPADGVTDVYQRVQHAIAHKRVLRCSYASISSRRGDNGQGDSDAPFDFHPYALLFNQRAWYVLGHHGGRGEVRCLKLNRFTAIGRTEQRFTVPQDFSVEAHLGDAWRMIRGRRKHEVEIVFDPEFAETVADTHWHPTQQVDCHDDGSITFRAKVEGLDEIVWWVLSMGPHCTVRKPKELARQVQKLASQIVACYAEADEKCATG